MTQGKDLIDPDAPSVAKGSPATLNDYAEDLSTRARSQVTDDRVAAKAESDRLEAPVKTAPIDAAPVQAALNDIITNPSKKYGKDTRDVAKGLLDRFNAGRRPDRQHDLVRADEGAARKFQRPSQPIAFAWRRLAWPTPARRSEKTSRRSSRR